MAREKQQRVVDFLKNGGRALIAPLLPRYDDNFILCTVLADYLGDPELEMNDERQVRINVGPIENIFNNGGVYFSKKLPHFAEPLGIDQFTGKTIAWAFSPKGGGNFIFLGFHWMHAKNEQSRMLAWLLGKLGLIQQVRCSNPNVWTSLRRHGNKSMLFAMNLSTSPMEADLSCLNFHGHFSLAPMSVRAEFLD